MPPIVSLVRCPRWPRLVLPLANRFLMTWLLVGGFSLVLFQFGLIVALAQMSPAETGQTAYRDVVAVQAGLWSLAGVVAARLLLKLAIFQPTSTPLLLTDLDGQLSRSVSMLLLGIAAVPPAVALPLTLCLGVAYGLPLGDTLFVAAMPALPAAVLALATRIGSRIPIWFSVAAIAAGTLLATLWTFGTFVRLERDEAVDQAKQAITEYQSKERQRLRKAITRLPPDFRDEMQELELSRVPAMRDIPVPESLRANLSPTLSRSDRALLTVAETIEATLGRGLRSLAGMNYFLATRPIERAAARGDILLTYAVVLGTLLLVGPPFRACTAAAAEKKSKRGLTLGELAFGEAKRRPSKRLPPGHTPLMARYIRDGQVTRLSDVLTLLVIGAATLLLILVSGARSLGDALTLRKVVEASLFGAVAGGACWTAFGGMLVAAGVVKAELEHDRHQMLRLAGIGPRRLLSQARFAGLVAVGIGMAVTVSAYLTWIFATTLTDRAGVRGFADPIRPDLFVVLMATLVVLGLYTTLVGSIEATKAQASGWERLARMIPCWIPPLYLIALPRYEAEVLATFGGGIERLPSIRPLHPDDDPYGPSVPPQIEPMTHPQRDPRKAIAHANRRAQNRTASIPPAAPPSRVKPPPRRRKDDDYVASVDD